MLEALLLAVELNGQQLSRGALVRPMGPGHCQVEAPVLEGELSAEARAELRTAQDPDWINLPPWGECQIDAAGGRARLTMPVRLMRPKSLRLGAEPAGTSLLAPLFPGDRSAAVPPQAVAIPSLALDLVASAARQEAGLIASHRGEQLQLRRAWSGPTSQTRVALESLQTDGAVFQLGHQTVGLGRDKAPAEWRGLSWTSQHAAIAPSPAARGEFELQSPARVRFFDQQGQPLFSDRLLAPGRYSLEGIGAPSRPGLLRVDVAGLDGERTSIELPWVAAPQLLEADQHQWQLLAGDRMQATYAHGLSHHETLRLGYLHRDSQLREAWMGLASRRIMRMVAELSLGPRCAPGCLWTGESVLQLRPSARMDLQLRLSPQSSQLSLQSPISDRTSLSLMVSGQDQLLRLTHRLTPQAEISFQARRASSLEPSQSYLLQLSLGLDPRWRLSLSGQHRPSGQMALAASLQQQSSRVEGEQVQLSQQQDVVTSQEVILRAARPYGDLQLQASRRVQRLGPANEQQQITGQVASRLWITETGLHLGPVGQHNLVVHDLGINAPIEMKQGEDLWRQADDQGRVAFSRTPSWTRSRYQFNQKRLPFWMHWRGGPVELPLTSQRAYRINLADAWQASLSLQLDLAPETVAAIVSLRDAGGHRLNWLPDGYIDLQDPRRLPVQVLLQSGQHLRCGDNTPPPTEDGGLLLSCRPDPTSPSDPWPSQKSPLLRTTGG